MNKTEQVNAIDINVDDKIRFGGSDLEVFSVEAWGQSVKIVFKMTNGNRIASVHLAQGATVDRVIEPKTVIRRIRDIKPGMFVNGDSGELVRVDHVCLSEDVIALRANYVTIKTGHPNMLVHVKFDDET